LSWKGKQAGVLYWAKSVLVGFGSSAAKVKTAAGVAGIGSHS
jgi:hypothetical protein